MNRRIDELGRVVIPIELRKKLRLQVGDTVEFSLVNNEMLLKKYSTLEKITEFLQEILDIIYKVLKKDIMITNTDKVIAYKGIGNYLNAEISEYLESLIKRRESLLETYTKEINITKENINTQYAVETITFNSEPIGIILIMGEKIDETDYDIIKMVSKFIEKHLEY